MKFKIKYADQIVGLFSLIGLVGLIVLIFSIGMTQKWFQKKNTYYTMIDNSSGIAVGKDLTYKGFSIGKIKSISLEGSQVRVNYYILKDYDEYIRQYSLVEFASSPFGSSFVFHPGNGSGIIESGSEIFRTDSATGTDYIAKGLITIDGSSDSIAVILNKVTTLVDNINILLGQVNEAFAGTDRTEIGKIIKNIDNVLGDVDGILSGTGGSDINKTLAEINDLLATINSEGIPALLGKENSKEIAGIISNLESLTGDASHLVANLDPQVSDLLVQVNQAVIQMRDVLSGVKNIGFIKKGVEEHSGANTSTVQLRSTEF
ncbi:MlaD family protein [Treponema sp.]|uniref:MlaD family protein n=1 Tax=Treponema sp. TaxID=166 RepID=UPI00388F60CA